jgi:toluene monooxygenase electron transfer component
MTKHKIEIESGATFYVAADEDSLLRGALRAGAGFPYECGVGGCGGCRFELVSGEMETLWPEAPGLSERERRRGRRLACQSRPMSDCVIRVRCAEEYRPPVATRRLQARFVQRREIAPGMAEFIFRTDEPARFLPGQYAIFHPPGVEGPRAFSMSNLPNGEGEWRFVIRKVPEGRGSSAMFDALRQSDVIALDAPYGGAYFRPAIDREAICVGGGSGVGPVVSVARAALVSGGRKVRLIEGARTSGDLCGPALFSAETLKALSYRPVLSAEPEASDWAGARGFLHQEVERSLQTPENCEFYFAGPPPMIEAMQELLIMRWKVPHARIHYDKFF